MKLLDFPELRQTFEYDCGAKVLQAILVYYGIELREEILLQQAATDKKKGTTRQGVARVLKKYKLSFVSESMTLENLKDYIDQKIPVLLLLQAWGDQPIKYDKDWHDNHWVVMIGYDQRKIFFEDPYTFVRATLTNAELEKRWHAQENKRKIFHHGIAVFGKKPVFSSKKTMHMG